jgi:pimeloyl-ACP methyl ester carboxylesterase
MVGSRVHSHLMGVIAMFGAIAASVSSAKAASVDVAVMIHGAGGGGWEYDRWKPIWEKAGWKVIAPDLMPSKGGLAKTTFADYAAQVEKRIPKNRRRLVLVGASMGGVLALKVAERVRPDVLILVNSAPPAGVGKARTGKPYPPIIRWANGNIKDTRDALPDGDEATVQWAHPKWRDESGAVLNTIQRGVKVQKPAVPTLVILGAKDTDVRPEIGLALAKWINADVHLYAGASHIGPLYGRRAAQIAKAAVQWLSALPQNANTRQTK